jgi:hypothetical protein
MSISIPSLVRTLAPILIPTGIPGTGLPLAQRNIGPGGVQQVPPGVWATQGENPPSQIINADNAATFINHQEVNNSRNRALQEAEQISNSINVDGEANAIMLKNQKALGLTGGANGFYDISLVSTAKDADEPDGFRLYLICPPRPAVSVALAAIGTGIEKATDLVKEVADTGAYVADKLAATGVAPTAETTSNILSGTGAGVQEIGRAIKKYMVDSGDEFNSKFNEYISNSYDGPDGNAFYSIVLPVPKELIDSHNHQTDNIMMGLTPRILAGIGGLADAAGKGIGKLKKPAGGGKNQGTGIGGALGDALFPLFAEAGAYAADTARLALGVGLNPNVEAIYSMPTPRTFNFTFELYVKSKDESDHVRDFIQRLKQHSYPLSTLSIGGQSQIYLYPGEVYFEFSGRYRNNIFRSLRPCIITGIQINYSNGDQYQHFEDGSSIVYTVTINLLENKLLDRNILVDDAKKFSNNEFGDKNFRNKIKFKDTIFRESVEQLLTNPLGTINDLFGSNIKEKDFK